MKPSLCSVKKTIHADHEVQKCEVIRLRGLPGGRQGFEGLQCKVIRPKEQDPPGWSWSCSCGAEPALFILWSLGSLTHQSHTCTGVFVASEANYLKRKLSCVDMVPHRQQRHSFIINAAFPWTKWGQKCSAANALTQWWSCAFSGNAETHMRSDMNRINKTIRHQTMVL